MYKWYSYDFLISLLVSDLQKTGSSKVSKASGSCYSKALWWRFLHDMNDFWWSLTKKSWTECFHFLFLAQRHLKTNENDAPWSLISYVETMVHHSAKSTDFRDLIDWKYKHWCSVGLTLKIVLENCDFPMLKWFQIGKWVWITHFPSQFWALKGVQMAYNK